MDKDKLLLLWVKRSSVHLLIKKTIMAIKSDNKQKTVSGIICLTTVGVIFGYLAWMMGMSNMLKTMMYTAHDLLLNTVLYLMAICVLTGALGKIFMEFGVVHIIEQLLKPLMRPLFHMPGVASLGAVLTFLSDNPAIISLAHDKRFSTYFKKVQFISLTNFGTAFGMGMLVIVSMMGHGYFVAPLVGLVGAFVGCIVSTRMMQRLVLRDYPQYATEEVVDGEENANYNVDDEEHETKDSLFVRILNALLDGGKDGVRCGVEIIPGVLIISTFVMMLTFGAGEGGYTGAAYQGVELLPYLAQKINFIFQWLFGFNDPHLVAFPITALGAVGAALGLIPTFATNGWIDANAIAVFTAIGMCWSGYLSTHTAMLDSLGYRNLTPKAIASHTVGGLVAGITAHLMFALITLIAGNGIM